MKPRKYLLTYVKDAGGIPAAASKLKLPYPTLAAICNGTRGISRGMAERMAKASSGLLDPTILVWVTATKIEAKPKAA